MVELEVTKDGQKAMAKFLTKIGAFRKNSTRNQPMEEDQENDEDEERWWRRMEKRTGHERGRMEEGEGADEEQGW